MIAELQQVYADFEKAKSELEAAKLRMRRARQALICAIEKMRNDLDVMPAGRQGQVLKMLIEGKTNKEIANSLQITERTVKFHVSNVLEHFECSDRRELMRRFSSGAA